MKGVQIQNNRILYYGNIAGYIKKGKAVVDPLFQNEELQSYLTEREGLNVEWRNGTFARLTKSGPEDNGPVLKNCRVWQLKPETDVMMKFIGYDELLEQFGEPDPSRYRAVYDGEVETNDMEQLFAKFNLDHPPGYEGHSLSISDVVELYDDSGSSFHYVDRAGFREITFQATGQEQSQGPQMNL